VVVSGLVWNFIPNQRKAMLESLRVARSGGTIAAYVWDYPDRMELMWQFWDAAVKLDSSACALDERTRFAACTADELRHGFSGAGLENVDTVAIDIPTRFKSFEDYWEPFLGGQGPAPAYAMSLSASAREKLREALRARLPIAADGSLELVARAWGVRGTST
jgi:hypothetical protein